MERHQDARLRCQYENHTGALDYRFRGSNTAKFLNIYFLKTAKKTKNIENGPLFNISFTKHFNVKSNLLCFKKIFFWL